jgi:hypothetical protein
MACVALHPLVDQLEVDLGKRAEVLRVSLLTPVGRQLAAQHNVTEAPTFIVLNANGTETARSNYVPTIAVVLPDQA